MNDQRFHNAGRLGAKETGTLPETIEDIARPNSRVFISCPKRVDLDAETQLFDKYVTDRRAPDHLATSDSSVLFSW